MQPEVHTSRFTEPGSHQQLPVVSRRRSELRRLQAPHLRICKSADVKPEDKEGPLSLERHPAQSQATAVRGYPESKLGTLDRTATSDQLLKHS